MDRTRPLRAETFEVELSGITFVPCESIAGINRIQFDHNAISGDLRYHTRRRDRKAAPVTTYKRRLWTGKWLNRQPVNERMLRRDPQRANGAAHRFVARTENVEPVDLVTLDHRNSP